MRENIGLYRGKRLSDGTWQHGCLLVYGNRYFIIPNEELIESEVESRFYWHLLEKHYEVYPETVGRYIGNPGRNGKGVYEGDIVRHYNRDDKPGHFEVGRIWWDTEKLCYRRTRPDGSSCLAWKSSTYEVIGNIIDNPELMEE